MTTKTRERLFAGGMTVGLLLLFWLLAAGVEIQRRSSNLRELTFSDGFKPAMTRHAPARPEITPESPTVVRRQVAVLPEGVNMHPSLLMPRQPIQTRKLEVQGHGIQLNPKARPFESQHTEIPQRPSPTSLLLSASSTTELSLIERTQPMLETAALTERATTKKMTLSSRANTPKDTARILRTEESEKIVQWMQLSQSELPRGIKRHVEYQSGAVTSVASLDYGDETVEIYLMVRLPSQELHVVIVRGNSTYYVVDPSFKREGRRFRVGTALRTDGEITAITSEERAASHENARHHYDVFLAWWDQLNVTLQ